MYVFFNFIVSFITISCTSKSFVFSFKNVLDQILGIEESDSELESGMQNEKLGVQMNVNLNLWDQFRLAQKKCLGENQLK